MNESYIYKLALWTYMRDAPLLERMVEEDILQDKLCYMDRALKYIRDRRYYEAFIRYITEPKSRVHYRPKYTITEHPDKQYTRVQFTPNQEFLYVADDRDRALHLFNDVYTTNYAVSCYGKNSFYLTKGVMK